MSTVTIPDSRLRSAIPYLTPNGRVADIGTDHAYLPIYLVQQGYSACALACDVNEGPLRSARANIAAVGLQDRIDTLHTDGLHGVERFSPTDVLIFGMGGELIARILSEADWIKTADVGLILQPMSRASCLRQWLTENGFSILAESITIEDKYYQTIHARFGKSEAPYTEEELLIGRRNIEDPPPLFKGFLEHEMHVVEGIRAGKARSRSADTCAEDRMLCLLKQRLEELQ